MARGFFNPVRRFNSLAQATKEAAMGGGKNAGKMTAGVLEKSGKVAGNILGAVMLPFEGMARIAKTRPGKAVLGFAIVMSAVAAIGTFLGHRHKVTREEREAQAADREMAISKARQDGFRSEMRQFAKDMSAIPMSERPDINLNAKGGHLARLQAQEAEVQVQGQSGGRS